VWKKIGMAAIVFGFLGVSAFVTGPVKEEERIGSDQDEESFEPIVVLELFTSQGCSSCPAADALLNQTKQKSLDNVFTLSYHVDYWNYIGWEDPFSSSQYAKKQQLYNRKFKSRGNYTPQLVINGKEHFVGSNASKLHEEMATFGRLPAANKVRLTEVRKQADQISLRYEVKGEINDKKIRALLVLDERTTYVKRGENKNRTLVNSNIVVREQVEDLLATQGTMKVTVPGTIGPKDALRLIVLIETDSYDITGAAKNTIAM
jgi:hypothetical protein